MAVGLAVGVRVGNAVGVMVAIVNEGVLVTITGVWLEMTGARVDAGKGISVPQETSKKTRISMKQNFGMVFFRNLNEAAAFTKRRLTY